MARSRAAAIAEIVRQAQRRLAAERDVEIYRAAADPDMAALAQWSVQHIADIDG